MSISNRFEMDAAFLDEMEKYFFFAVISKNNDFSVLVFFWIFIKFVILTPICNSSIHIALCYKKYLIASSI